MIHVSVSRGISKPSFDSSSTARRTISVFMSLVHKAFNAAWESTRILIRPMGVLGIDHYPLEETETPVSKATGQYLQLNQLRARLKARRLLLGHPNAPLAEIMDNTDDRQSKRSRLTEINCKLAEAKDRLIQLTSARCCSGTQCEVKTA